ncbi:MAG: 50S ribosomal protein L6 [Candidatus Pelagibacter sp.]|nr:50S ribosomal protein L6 [Candidatus Pelagibacter sp.]|tara:strand:+ start:13495 stop:14031 length:537 start_codon:yes stop_codon:yes gene_type:complete
MSKIGKKNILVPNDVKVEIIDNKINLEGPKGKKSIEINKEYLNVTFSDGKISVTPKDPKNQNKIIWGLQRSLINNAVIGVGKGYTETLKLNGVGFRANLKDKQLQLQLGFSHDIFYNISEGISIKVDKQTTIVISGVDKELVGKTVADIKFYKPVEPYKQKGITSEGQFILKKEGKKK